MLTVWILTPGACVRATRKTSKVRPPLPQPEQDAARALGRQRFEVFVAQVGRRLASDHRLVSEVLESIAEHNPDLFATTADDEAPTNAAADAVSPHHPGRNGAADAEGGHG